ncbi:MAG: C25 family cysteine peptidase [Candidatus Methylarchaceae archaeon HK01M]|nr:C25 family cysteine peptidase [Candidatus Methylarchaceae archaeon HK01M]
MIIISSKTKLIDAYSETGFELIDYQLQKFQASLKDEGIESDIVYVDHEESLEKYNQNPVDPEKPDEIKALIDSIHQSLQQEILNVLIIGGHQIIPFHKLPDPTGDDFWIYSDNPYASTDEDYIVPERPLGRFPDGSSNDPCLIISQINNSIKYRKNKGSEFGKFCYTAFVWEKASKAVLDSANVTGHMHLILTPPLKQDSLDPKLLNKKLYNYFNLHGGENTPNWYGDDGTGAFPVAFTPQITNTNIEDIIVFTEACYGANILNKKIDDAISLKYLQNRAICFLGSTKIAYGPSEPPSSAADLIGVKFFQNLDNGLSFGEAVMKAKQDYAKEYITAGIFDDVDQKTLLEFVLFADPSLKRRVA